VGDHSRSHPVLTGLSRSGMASQIGAGTDAFRRLTGARTVPLFRPPYGSTNGAVAAVAGSEGFAYEVLWDVDPRDWAGGSAKSIADHVVGHAHNGAIVVMHMSAPHTAEAIPLIASRLRAKGYELVTVSEMLKGDRLFLDVDSGTQQGEAIARMFDLGFMSGYDRNYFGPAETITRAQVAKVAALVGGIHTPQVESADAPHFSDVPVKHDSQGNPIAYPFDYVEEAAGAGLVTGSVGADGIALFNPNATIARVQFAQILARMARQLKGYTDAPPGGSLAPAGAGDLQAAAAAEPATAAAIAAVDPAPIGLELAGLEPASLGPAATFADVPEYAAADVALVTRLGLMSGYSTGEFGVWAGAKRGQVALAMSRFLDLPDNSSI
ncbi:MAG: S-layer homology domain-containing protein, partial [Actinobacteria bacterium]|nr:S-layer homology domain-containing protein [Actinomycetota bacterium]